jgi:hypothetical protein
VATFTHSLPIEAVQPTLLYALTATQNNGPGFGPVELVDWAQANGSAAGAVTALGNPKPANDETAVNGATPADGTTGGLDWFEDFHVVPRSFSFGNLLSDQSEALEVFSAYRREVKQWTAFTNNAGAGVALGGAPSLSASMDPLTGYQITLEVSTSGPPFVDSTIVFTFGAVSISVPIDLQRIALWGARPQQPFRERLAFLTDVQEPVDGSEVRISVRDYPRHAWEYQHLIAEGLEVQVLENLLFDLHSQNFGVPVWFEECALTAAATAGDISVTVSSTSYRDFRVGGAAVVYTSQSTFDVLELTAIGASSLTFSSPLINSYAVGASVFPLAVCRVPSQVTGARYPVNLQQLAIRFESVDNVADLADASAFATYNSKVLISENPMRGSTVRFAHQQRIERLDGLVGNVYQFSPWDRNKREHALTFRADGLQAVWELRGLLHALRGRATSFYVARSSSDFVVVANIASGLSTLDVSHVGYTQFVRSRQPKNAIRVTLADGTTIDRAITSSAEVSSTVERLTVSVAWSSTVAVADVARVEYIEEVRFATDTFLIEYARAGAIARMTAPVVTVFG